MSVIEPKARRALKDALNGDHDSVDAAVRRALFALSTELDEHRAETQAQKQEIIDHIDGVVEGMRKSLSRVQALLITAAVTGFGAAASMVASLIQ